MAVYRSIVTNYILLPLTHYSEKVPGKKWADRTGIEYDSQSRGRENPKMSIRKLKLLNKIQRIHNDFPWTCGTPRLGV